MKSMKILFGIVFLVLATSPVLLAAPPAAFLSDDDPGINFLFSGDPQTTEDGCTQDGRRASLGDLGKNHNELAECDNWDFKPQEWGKAAFLQGQFILGQSPFSDDGGWECLGNAGPGGFNPCANSTVRAGSTFKNTPLPPGLSLFQGIPMDISKDWVFSFDFRIGIPVGDTFGNDKLFETIADTGDIMKLLGAGDSGGSFLNGEADRYRLYHGDGAGNHISTLINVPVQQGHITLHYKAANERMDLWLDDMKLVGDFASFNNGYGINRIQLGGGSPSFENALYDNVVLGIVAGTVACGPQGPGSSAPGDFNCDGTVDVADLGIIGANFNGGSVTYVDGDANLDGVVDVADLGVVGANWSAAQSGELLHALQSAGLGALIPEPTTVTMVAVGALGLVRRRVSRRIQVAKKK